MYSIKFYKDKNGKEPVKDYLSTLGKKKDKDSRLNFNKIRDYIKILSQHGTRAGEPFAWKSIFKNIYLFYEKMQNIRLSF